MHNGIIIGERLRLRVNEADFASRVRDVYPDGRLLIQAPGSNGRAVELTPGDTVELTYNDVAGQISFAAQVGERLHLDDEECYVMAYASLITKSQRRGFARVDKILPIGVRVLGTQTGDGGAITIARLIENLAQDSSPVSSAPLYQTVTLDLSGGGVAFASKIPFAPNILVQCEMTIGGKPFRAEGLVTYVDEDAARDPRFKISVQFAEMDARQQRRIIRYLMDAENAPRAV